MHSSRPAHEQGIGWQVSSVAASIMAAAVVGAMAHTGLPSQGPLVRVFWRGTAFSGEAQWNGFRVQVMGITKEGLLVHRVAPRSRGE